MAKITEFGADLKQSAKGWINDNVMLHASSLAYYTVFSIAPLLLIAIAITGFILGQEASQGKVFGEVQGLVGASGASMVQTMVQSAANQPHSGWIATIISIATLILGAAGVFQQLQESLNTIWEVRAPEGTGIWHWLRRRVLTFAMVGVIAFLLLASLLASAALAAAEKFLGTSILWQFANFGISIGVITLLFAAVYKFLPDVHLRWRDLIPASLLTAALFSVGKWLIGLYLGKSSVSSSYGAAGSLVVLLVWVYYSAMILYFGAEYAKATVQRKGRLLKAKSGATFLKTEERDAGDFKRAAA